MKRLTPAPPARFSLGVDYRPSDREVGGVRDDFAAMAALGLDAVRIFVPWNDVQPEPDGVDAHTLDDLVATIAAASDAGLRVLASLAFALDGVDCTPAWSRRGPLYTGAVLDAQVMLATAVAERLRDLRASLVAWDLAHAFSLVRPPRRGKAASGDHGAAPVSEHEVAAWSTALARPLRAAAIPVTIGTPVDDLLTDTDVRLGSLCTPCAFASLQTTTPLAFGRGQLDPEPVPFLAMVTTAFSFKPVLVTALGVAADDEHASLAAAILDRLHADGRLGVYWSHWRDDHLGVLDRSGTRRPAAAALARFAATHPSVQRASDMPMIGSTYYYRTLPDSLATLFAAYLGVVETRRAAF